MACPKNPAPPQGYRIWRKPVPADLAQWAVQMRDQWMPHANYGDNTGLDYTAPGAVSSIQVLARKDYHTWTYRNGKLIQGICIPGVTLYEPLLTQATAASNVADDLATPDPNAATFSVDVDASGVPIEDETAPNTGLIVATAVAAAAVIGAFIAAVTNKIR